MSKELKIGAFVVTVFVASFFLINYLRGEDIFDREFELVSCFETVDGLVASAPVYVKGYKAGKVSDVVYNADDENFTVICSISKEFRVPIDSKMTIYSVDIMGGKGIRIDLGKSQTSASDGDALTPAFEKGLMDGLAEGIGPLLGKVNNTLDSLSVTVEGVNRILLDGNQIKIENTLAHLEMTMADLNRLSASVGGRSSEIEAMIVNISDLSAKFNTIAEKVDTTVSGVNSLVGSVNPADIEALVSSFRLLLENINDPDGTVGKLLSDDSVYNSVDELLSDVDGLVKKIQENPKKYIKISVF